jgi:hypothetical protein
MGLVPPGPYEFDVSVRENLYDFFGNGQFVVLIFCRLYFTISVERGSLDRGYFLRWFQIRLS